MQYPGGDLQLYDHVDREPSSVDNGHSIIKPQGYTVLVKKRCDVFIDFFPLLSDQCSFTAVARKVFVLTVA